MSFFKKLFGRSETTPQEPPASQDPRSDPNLIRIFDEFGRECFIPKSAWRKDVLPGSLRTNWNDPEGLAGIVNGAMHDGFFADVVDAAAQLHRIDPVKTRGTCVYGIVLMKLGRLQEAERILRDHLDRHGEDGYVLTNLAKVQDSKGDRQQSETTLWRALEVDPNQENGLGWYVALRRERYQEDNASAWSRVAALPGSWRAQVWLARTALESGHLDRALDLYRQVLAGIEGSLYTDMLVQMTGDLGNHGHLRELVELAESRFVPEIHGLQVGNNLIKAHVDLGQIEPARKMLDSLYALKRPDWKNQLSFWDTEIAKARLPPVPTEPIVSVEMQLLEGPIWLKPSSPARVLFPAPAGAPSLLVGFLGSSIADAPGRMSRIIPLFLAEETELNLGCKTEVFVPFVPEGFVLSGVSSPDEAAVSYAKLCEEAPDYMVTTHLRTDAKAWTVSLRLVRVADQVCVAELGAIFPPAEPESGLPSLARELGEHLSSGDRPDLPLERRSPRDAQLGPYLLRLEQLLAVRCTPPQEASKFLSGEHQILAGNLDLCLALPDNIRARLLLIETFVAMKRVRPSVAAEFEDKLALLQKKYPLTHYAQQLVQRILDQPPSA